MICSSDLRSFLALWQSYYLIRSRLRPHPLQLCHGSVALLHPFTAQPTAILFAFATFCLLLLLYRTDLDFRNARRFTYSARCTTTSAILYLASHPIQRRIDSKHSLQSIATFGALLRTEIVIRSLRTRKTLCGWSKGASLLYLSIPTIESSLRFSFCRRFEWEMFGILAEQYPGLEEVKLEIDPERSVSIFTLVGLGASEARTKQEVNVGWGCFPPRKSYSIVISKESHGTAFHRAKYGYQDTLGTLGWIKGRNETKNASNVDGV